MHDAASYRRQAEALYELEVGGYFPPRIPKAIGISYPDSCAVGGGGRRSRRIVRKTTTMIIIGIAQGCPRTMAL